VEAPKKNSRPNLSPQPQKNSAEDKEQQTREEIERIVDTQMHNKPFVERERFANVYADKIITALKKQGGIPFPFPRKVDNIEHDGLKKQDFILEDSTQKTSE